MKNFNILEDYGWHVKSHSELNSSIPRAKNKQTSFIQHDFLSGRENDKQYVTLNVGGFFLASNNILIPEAKKNSWIVPQMISLAQAGFIDKANMLDIDFTEEELASVMFNMKEYFDVNMDAHFERNKKMYAVLVWMNGMVFDDCMTDFLTIRYNVNNGLSLLKIMFSLQPKGKAMVPVFQDALNFLNVPYSYVSRILM